MAEEEFTTIRVKKEDLERFKGMQIEYEPDHAAFTRLLDEHEKRAKK